MCKINGKSAKNIARKSGKHQRSKNPPNWFLKGSVVFVGSEREVTLYSAYNFLIESKKEDGEACRRPFCPMAEFALARAVPAAKLTDEMHAQGHPYFRVSADAGRPGEGAGHCCIPVGLMISNSRMTVLQCSPSRRLQPSSAESLPLGSKSLKYSLALG